METKAVLTGDIINSKKIDNKALLMRKTRAIFDDLERQFVFKNNFEIYRGDSFQALLNEPKYSLRIAYLVRLGLMKTADLWDARIAIGVGGISFENNDVKISNGEAFELSGQTIDSIKDSTNRIAITIADKNLNKQLYVLNAMSDAISKRWSKKTAEVLYLQLLYSKTQKEIAKELNISQSAVQQRMAAADFEVINSYISYFENDLFA